jgi:hypothetical protein
MSKPLASEDLRLCGRGWKTGRPAVAEGRETTVPAARPIVQRDSPSDQVIESVAERCCQLTRQYEVAVRQARRRLAAAPIATATRPPRLRVSHVILLVLWCCCCWLRLRQ